MHWRKVSTKRERAHHDGVMIDYDSPEAFEQVFWTTFLGDSYRLPDRLVPHAVDDATIEKFRRYVAAILLCSPRTDMLYLSKNNNNILRLPSIRRAFPEALIIVPFRHPLSQALSLMAQHEKFCAIQTADPFTRAYMSWLAHHEFGLTHRPFVFADGEEILRRRYKSTQLEYWLMGWIQVYRYLLEHAPGAIFVSYEALCEGPHRTLSAVLTAASLQIDVELMAPSIRPAREANMPTVEQEILNSALEIHDRLLAVATT